jgi:light-regulated signal transduction histidine kinase (bacteriophytochrome)
VFQNLIGNAVKFHRDSPPVVEIGAERGRDGWTISVKDNGIGIEAQYSERIFQMFQRLHDRESYEGNGIGLPIAKKIVERHGGRIWFESLPNEGTTFFFTLPQSQEKAA